MFTFSLTTIFVFVNWKTLPVGDEHARMLQMVGTWIDQKSVAAVIVLMTF